MPRVAEDDIIAPPNRRQTTTATTHGFEIQTHHYQTQAKSNLKFLSLLLKTLVMVFLISLFFLFVGIASIFLIHLFLAGGALHHRRSRRSNSNEFSPENLQKLPAFIYGRQDGSKSVRECAICLDLFRDGEACRNLPSCDHVFHLDCVNRWLIKVPACPICRTHVRFDVGSCR